VVVVRVIQTQHKLVQVHLAAQAVVVVGELAADLQVYQVKEQLAAKVTEAKVPLNRVAAEVVQAQQV
jgi:hypothetical protein